ncbi:MAG: hypothetical protein OHK0044_06600 [Burkholderiaceae bacterium]
MSEDRPLTPHEAEAVVEQRIEMFGLGALPRVSVTPLPDGMWRVRWENLEATVAPMTAQAWHAWLEENVGSLDPGDLETTES